ncbi:nitroreductase family protein [Herbiconiux sp. YIM B11900]|uniref:nitroreductase family protein n=1 Tax=Herbiconiux sp. YIM B11900 TaxID=3404131 RepID=UPI003F840FFE
MTSTAPAPALTSRFAETSTPIHPALAGRWSPRSFVTTEPIDETALTAALEAARWAPSANNSQPARFIVGRRGSAVFDTIVANLLGFNQVWAGSAAALVVGIAETSDDEGTPRRFAEYDLGQALAHLTVQAQLDGLHVHQMGGIDAAALSAAFDLPANQVPITVAALGILGTPDALPDEALRSRETAPRARRPLAEIVLVSE